MVILVLFILVFFGGILTGDWFIIAIGGLPFLCGIIGFVLITMGENKLEEEMEINPEVREIVQDIERQKKQLGW